MINFQFQHHLRFRSVGVPRLSRNISNKPISLIHHLIPKPSNQSKGFSRLFQFLRIVDQFKFIDYFLYVAIHDISQIIKR